MKDVKSILQEAELHLSKDQYQKAESLFHKILLLKKNDLDSLLGLSNIKIRTKNFTEALSWIEKVLEINSNYKEAYITKAIILKEMKEYQKALDTLKKYLTFDPDHALVINEIGILNSYMENFEESIKWLEKAKHLLPRNFQTFYVLGFSYEKLLDYENSILNYKKAIELNPNYIDAYMNCANLLRKKKQYQEARFLYEKVVHLNKNFAPAFNNLGILFDEIKDYTKSLFCFKKAIEIDTKYVDAYLNCANMLVMSMNKPSEAPYYLDKAYSLNPNDEYLLGKLMYCKLAACDWKNFESLLNQVEKDLLADKKTLTSFQSLLLLDSSKLNRLSTKAFKDSMSVKKIYQKKLFQKRNVNSKIRIGYFSPDFRSHPIGYLLKDIIKLHDRKKFEVYGFNLKEDKSCELQKYFSDHFDFFINVENLNTKEILDICYDKNIDIALDLAGYTSASRPEIFINRCAPIQINYMAIAGTSTKDHADYIIADKVLIDEKNKVYFDEKPIFMPNCYLPPVQYAKYEKDLKKKDFNLPEDKFIFCSFNNQFKILPNVFKSWMNILKSCENSILWLFVDNEIAKKNLLNEANKLGIKNEKIFFCERVDQDTHIRRIGLGDLFLDTFPYTGHLTASNALSFCVPVLTVAGETFQSRVAKSLLNDLNLLELSCDTFSEYEKKAIRLANDKDFYRNIKEKLKVNLKKSPLCNIELYVKNLEQLYKQVYQDHLKKIN